jgi:hypothetical protein
MFGMSEFNLTKEQMDDFIKLNAIVTTNFTNQNKSIDMHLDEEMTNSSRPQDCLGYCDSEMLEIFKDYKLYHGYVTLVVS